MCDDSRNNERAVEEYYKDPTEEEQHKMDAESFIEAAKGDLTAKAPFSYAHKNATVFDMMEFSLNTKGGVTLATVFSYLAKAADEDEEAEAILDGMADQFIWRAF